MQAAEARRPTLFTIPAHVAFADALVDGLIARYGGDALGLARLTVILPNRRAVRAVTDAFVRAAGDRGLLLPRLAPIGDLDADEALGRFAEDINAEITLPPAIDEMERRLILAQLVRRLPQGDGRPLSAVEAMRLADALARTLDQLTLEGVDVSRLRDVVADAELATHWQRTLHFLEIILASWPAILAERGKSDGAARRMLLIDAQARRWADNPPESPIVAAGITGTFPAAARLLRVIARLPYGAVVLPGLDLSMRAEEWQAIRCSAPGDSGDGPDSETHPQYGLKTLLAGMDVARGEVALWPSTTAQNGSPARLAAVSRAMAPAAFTGEWRHSVIDADAFADVTMVAAKSPQEEAQVIALALREQLETPGATAALVTPDRALARRVAVLLARWGIEIDDTAGTALRVRPAGTLIQALAEAAVSHFAPVPLLALLKHPLVHEGAGRLAWLDQVRLLDRALRGVRPGPGLAGVTARLEDKGSVRAAGAGIDALRAWWADVAAQLQPLAVLLAAENCTLPDLVSCLTDTATQLASERLWQGADGRGLSTLMAGLAAHGAPFGVFETADAPALLGHLLGGVAIRPTYGKHPRLFIWGLLEARLQRADLLLLGGLNEGVWPAQPAPDPWLPPKVRADLGLPGPERNAGLAAHDFVQLMGARRVILTRAERDATAPTVASRLWLRLQALKPDAIARDTRLLAIARQLQTSDVVTRAARPAFAPPRMARPTTISVTQADRLKADPFSWYADRILKLGPLDPLDQDPTAAERGTAIHAIMENWAKRGHEDPALLPRFIAEGLAAFSGQPLLHALWVPRVRRAVEWAAAETASWRADGWTLSGVEAKGQAVIAGVTLTGKADRIDRGADGTLAVVDYKTGNPPVHAMVQDGFALQLGLLALLAQDGALQDVPAVPVSRLSYWKLSGGAGTVGEERDPLLYNGKPWIDTSGFIARCRDDFAQLAAVYLLGNAPFIAKAHSEYAERYRDYDHLARVAEWLGQDL